MPGYEPFLLCDFHVHTRWSDGRLTLRQVIDLYGQTGKFDVIAITDHILMRKDVIARLGRAATLGRRSFGIEEDEFQDYLAEISSDFRKPKHLYSWKTLVRAAKNWPAIREALRQNVDVALTLYRERSWVAV